MDELLLKLKTKSTYNYPCFDYDAWSLVNTLTSENSVQPETL